MKYVFVCVMALAACGDDGGEGELSDPDTVVDLDFTEIMPVQFGVMAPGVAELAVFELPSYRTDAQFEVVEPRLRCASIDAAASTLTATRLETAGGATIVDYTVRVGAPGGPFTTLATFDGSFSQGESVALDASGVTFDPAGLSRISAIVLGDDPTLSVEVSASVPGSVTALDLELELVVSMSTSAKRCP